MNISELSDLQIFDMCEQFKSSRNAKMVYEQTNVPKSSFYKLLKRYGGLREEEISRIRKIEKEKDDLKKAYELLKINYDALKKLVSKKGWGLAYRGN